MALFRICIIIVAGLCYSSTQAQLTYRELQVQYDSVWTYQNLQLIPVRFKNTPAVTNEPAVISLAEGMQKKKIKVKELQSKDGADIYTLEMKNDSKDNIIINSGDMLSGGKQDRIFAESKIIKAGTSEYVNVYCIEKGRWDEKAKPFAFSGSANADLRKTMDLTNRQVEVWKEIGKQFAAAGKKTTTTSFLQLFTYSRQIDTAYNNYFQGRYQKTDSAFAGFIAITGDRIIFCELFSSPEYTRIAWPSLLNSAVATAINNGATPSVTDKQLRTFLDKLMNDEASQKTYVSMHGRMQHHNGVVFHLIAYED